MKGFSLVELIVVLALLGVMAGAVAPAVTRTLIRSPGEQLVASIADTLRAVRREALRRGQPASLTVEPQTGRFWIALERPPRADSVREGKWTLPPATTLLHHRDRAQMRFAPAGVLRADSLVVRSDASVGIIAVDQWSGAVTLR